MKGITTMQKGSCTALACAGVAVGQNVAATKQIAAGGAAGGTDLAPVFLRAKPIWPQGRETEKNLNGVVLSAGLGQWVGRYLRVLQ